MCSEGFGGEELQERAKENRSQGIVSSHSSARHGEKNGKRGEVPR